MVALSAALFILELFLMTESLKKLFMSLFKPCNPLEYQHTSQTRSVCRAGMNCLGYD